MSQPIIKVSYTLWLLTNMGNEVGGKLLVDSYTFEPNLSQGDVVHIQEWKVGVETDYKLQNQPFSFEARVMEIEKVVVRHHSFVVNIILESPDRETISQLIEALRDNNPEQFPKEV
ncbi:MULTISPECIES: hypothetical protein [unclassified Microcoleus]|uniref:hypothetical protein n=1 Tax=unclassified Microcoleus TaxID=2642155 RepID=UPI002FD76632